jgi:hypothetical protein
MDMLEWAGYVHLVDLASHAQRDYFSLSNDQFVVSDIAVISNYLIASAPPMSVDFTAYANILARIRDVLPSIQLNSIIPKPIVAEEVPKVVETRNNALIIESFNVNKIKLPTSMFLRGNSSSGAKDVIAQIVWSLDDKFDTTYVYTTCVRSHAAYRVWLFDEDVKTKADELEGWIRGILDDRELTAKSGKTLPQIALVLEDVDSRYRNSPALMDLHKRGRFLNISIFEFSMSTSIFGRDAASGTTWCGTVGDLRGSAVDSVYKTMFADCGFDSCSHFTTAEHRVTQRKTGHCLLVNNRNHKLYKHVQDGVHADKYLVDDESTSSLSD